MTERIKTYREFWPYYLEQHRRPWTRRLHVMGTLVGTAFGIYCAITFGWPYLFLGLVVTYGFAWTSHFTIEKNKPATFRYPLWSLVSDFRMLLCWASGRLK